jgi:hypothetical protein
MQIRYSREKLWVFAIVCGHLAAAGVVLFLSPSHHFSGLYGLLLNGSFGHYITAPVAVSSFTFFAVRCVLLASGSAMALVVDNDGAKITTLWSSHRLRWGDLLGVRLAARTVRGNKVHWIEFERCNGSSVTLPLEGLSLGEYGHSCQRLFQTLSDSHAAAVQRSVTSRAAVHLLTEENLAARVVNASPTRPVFGLKKL